MPIDFPNSPSNGQSFTYGGRTWNFNGVAWAAEGSGGGGGGATGPTAVNFVIDGGNGTIVPGFGGSVIIPFNATITSWTLLADFSGSIVVDIWKSPYAGYPPSVANSITASAKPTITSATKATSSVLTGWTTSISAGDILAFNVNSVTTITKVTVGLTIDRL